MTLADAQGHYVPYECNPNRLSEQGRCLYQKACLGVRMEYLYGSASDHPAGLGENLPREEPPLPRATSLATEAFRCLPRGNQKLHPAD